MITIKQLGFSHSKRVIYKASFLIEEALTVHKVKNKQPLPNNWRWLKRGESYSPQLLSLEGMDFVLFTSFLIHKQLY